MIKLAFDYNIRQEVLIKPLEAYGMVVALYYSDNGPEYKVRYFYEGEARTEFFYPEELKPR